MAGADALDRLVRATVGEPVSVAFQGERGAYGHLLVERLWGANVWVTPCWTFADVIDAVTCRRSGFAVLPVHNEIIGEIPGVRSAIATAGLTLIAEVRQPIRHCLLGTPGSTLRDITTVYSHPAALAQCGAFLGRHPAMDFGESYDTAGAARDVAARALPNEAAIAGAGCAGRYGLQLLVEDIGDREDNATIFAVVGQRGPR